MDRKEKDKVLQRMLSVLPTSHNLQLEKDLDALEAMPEHKNVVKYLFHEYAKSRCVSRPIR